MAGEQRFAGISGSHDLSKTNHSKETVERYIRDFEAIRLLHSKFDDTRTISLITRLSEKVVHQYIDLIPAET